MGQARWVRVDWPEILEGWAQKMKAIKKIRVVWPDRNRPAGQLGSGQASPHGPFFLYIIIFSII